MQLLWTRHALLRRMEIFRYIAEDNIDAAIALDSLFDTQALSLLQFPCKGRIGRRRDTRELIIKSNYILVYRVVADTVRITTIHHGAQMFC